jgi:peptide/nickel transport system substrate-binding protein
LYFLGLGSNFSGQEELTYLRKGYIANSTYWENAEYLSLYDQLTGTFDGAKRQEIMNRMQAIALDDAPWIPLWHQVDIYGISRRLQWEPRADERINMYDATLS